MPNPSYAAYRAADPYFDLVRGALGDSVDGVHFFDIVSDDVVYEVLYEFPGWPRVVQGRSPLMAQFKGYGDNIELGSADHLITPQDGRTVEASSSNTKSMGPYVPQGVKYDNRFCSISKLRTGRLCAGGTTWTLSQPGMR